MKYKNATVTQILGPDPKKPKEKEMPPEEVGRWEVVGKVLGYPVSVTSDTKAKAIQAYDAFLNGVEHVRARRA